MSDEQINIAIAEACGLDVVRDGEFRKSLPRYCSDLNAMHEAEKVLEHEEIDLWSYYIYELNELIQRNNRVQFAIHATARQRAEAFLRTIDAKEL
jgi:hypothetical protein